MAPGKVGQHADSPILMALSEVEPLTTGEVRVHVSRHRRDPDPYGRATRVFEDYGMHRTTQENAVLVYVNLRARKFAFVAGRRASESLGARFFEGLSALLRDELLSTWHENAIATAVRTVGVALERYFPAGLDAETP